jgi:hypothetical protein
MQIIVFPMGMEWKQSSPAPNKCHAISGVDMLQTGEGATSEDPMGSSGASRAPYSELSAVC